MKRRLYIIAVVVLVAGLLSSLCVYVTAGSEQRNVLGYDIAGGELHPISPDESKMYRHDLEVYGGKVNVLMDKFTRWFEGLWQGKELAFTMAAITVVIFAVILVVAYYLPSGTGGSSQIR